MLQFVKHKINNIFTDNSNFFNIGTIICSIILLTIYIADAITTTKALSIGLHELNPVMKYIVESPALLILVKILGGIVTIFIIKHIHEVLSTLPSFKKYNNILVYIIFAIPSGITLAVVLHNLLVISHYL